MFIMKKIKIAVLGSPVTLDVFNPLFVKKTRNFYNCVLSQNQISFISLMSNPIPFEHTKIDNQPDEYSKENIYKELSKEVLSLLKKQRPSYIIIDFFGDIHHGVVKLNEKQYITNNRWKIKNTTFYKEIKEKETLEFSKEPDEYFKLWKKFITKFFGFLERELPSTKVIVHKTHNTDYSITNNKSIKQLSNSGKVRHENIPQLNFLWDKINQYVINTYQTECIDMTKKFYLSFEEHPWGEFYTHFTMDYYLDFFNKLNNIVLNDFPGLYHTILENTPLDTENILIKNAKEDYQSKERIKNALTYQKTLNDTLNDKNQKLINRINQLNKRKNIFSIIGLK
jgi:hypothetical protein